MSRLPLPSQRHSRGMNQRSTSQKIAPPPLRYKNSLAIRRESTSDDALCDSMTTWESDTKKELSP